MSGLLIAAPSSGSGKTTITLGLLRALRRRGVAVSPGKAGPDYIDPAFHTAACGIACINYDPWAMRPALLEAQAARARADGRLLVIEAMMGLFDAAMDGTGAPADLAAALGLPAVLVVDCGRMAHSVAALVSGYARFRPDVRLAGVILNKVGSPKHAAMLRGALAGIDMPVLGTIGRDPALALPERHLGLVQAGEHGGLDRFIDHAADAVEAGCDLDALVALGGEAGPVLPVRGHRPALDPLGARIAVARDVAFAFAYEHLLAGWHASGASLSFFSPLADEAPAPDCDAVYLPGGYPELHAGTLAAATTFRSGLQAAAVRQARIFGECGGYMTLGEGLIDAAGARHAMLGLLPLTTSFAERRRHLGYRRVRPLEKDGFFPPMMAHEFHYATIVTEGDAAPLFAVEDAAGTALGTAGLRRGSVAGSFMHLIDRACDGTCDGASGCDRARNRAVGPA
ncbi:cobyrinic acid a,c-diamide synthase [Rhizobium sp. Leaf384]|uniref:cobyrinate a,c-diamide synthase n=1 Tax=unclassified Rhizobium TaxID=2613769 RepID=UPI000713E81D|nr:MULTISPECIES: cobyrinate a,c-diamide synthase [unclassified Rhizobium]KQS79300.1 cobyrinic acid a,c-diamide synthase [Rhizobium sp. Leaf384]KQS82868.1 cobyrinic acid a,c-diamide synthase [Rhizobium sp. Leaf383]